MATATATRQPPNGNSATALPGSPVQPPYRSYEEGEYVVFEDVPVWCEHYSRQADQHFGPEELAQVVARCNERIEETNDFAPLVIRHTKDDGSADPPVVGLAGPFKLGTIGKQKPKTAILARMRFFKSDFDLAKRYPRVSVEYWFSKQDPTNGYFDPISLLGAETPELDLGIRYARRHAGRGEMCSRYSKTVIGFGDDKQRADYAASAMPGGVNTFVPTTAGMQGADHDRQRSGGHDRIDYDRDGAGRLPSPIDAAAIAQIVEALRPTIAEIVMQMVPVPQPQQQRDASELGDPYAADLDSGLDADADVDDADDMAGAEPFHADSAPAGPDGPSDLAGDADADNSDSEPSGTDGGKDAAAGSAPDSRSSKKEKHTMSVATAKDKQDDKTRSSQQTAGGDDTAVARYQKQVNDLTRERDEIKAKYEKAVRDASDSKAELKELQDRVGAIEANARHSARYAKLRDLEAEGYQFDIEDELKDFAQVSDEEFARHESRIRAHYSRVPLNGMQLTRPKSEGPDGNEATSDERARYSKEAAVNVERARREGQHADYGTELKAIYAREKKRMPE